MVKLGIVPSLLPDVDVEFSVTSLHHVCLHATMYHNGDIELNL